MPTRAEQSEKARRPFLIRRVQGKSGYTELRQGNNKIVPVYLKIFPLVTATVMLIRFTRGIRFAHCHVISLILIRLLSP